MKSKKIIIAFLCMAIFLSQIFILSGNSYAVENKSQENYYYNKFDFSEKATSSLMYNRYVKNIIETKENSMPAFTTSIVQNEEKDIYFGNEFEVNVKISDLINIERGILVVYGKLNYDKNVLNLIEMTPQKEWQIVYNEENQSFVMDNEKFINNENIEDNECILKIKFQVKDTITEETKTTIKISNILGSNSKIDIPSESASLEVNIVEEPVIEPIFTSEKYNIDENYITRIAPNTSFGKFKSNIETNQELVLRDRAGNLLESDSFGLATNMTLTVGEDKVYTIVVTADIVDTNGNGQITITDLARLKLHYIGLEELSETALKAADINNDGEISITDVAQLKLYIIGLMEIK